MNRRRGTRTERGYGTEYKRRRAALLADNPDCHWCGQPATTADHWPPLAYLREAGLDDDAGMLVPACAHCNYSHVGTRRLNGQQPPSRNW